MFPIDGFPGDLVTHSLEDILIQGHLVGNKLTVHHVAIHHEGANIEELVGHFRLYLDVINHRQGLIRRLAVCPARVVGEVLTQVNNKEEVILVRGVVLWDFLLELDGVVFHVWAPSAVDLAHELW